ncbi:hypothetical protein N7513_003308 [Penicillium frequentans]|uniref:Uncharacterized protein n=1 Tax=Penicillium frequentans TaxID=3151616 RepID=A0AAD6CXW6_9EURO|nr:hypothetical protein N7494_005312 [Penicillium glabrum]KAJ5557722.1 hypothetical protein N7513_003308 [Penicillium glabrum]
MTGLSPHLLLARKLKLTTWPSAKVRLKQDETSAPQARETQTPSKDNDGHPLDAGDPSRKQAIL